MKERRFNEVGFREALVSWFAEAGRDLPWRRTDDPYAVLVSEFMCQQTTVVAVVPYFERWMARWPTVSDLAAAGEDEVLSMWEGLGYYSRGRNLLAAAVAVVERFGGEVPEGYDDLRRLPGVGEYTANAVRAFAFDRVAPVVDGNVARVLARVFDFREAIDAGPGKAWLIAQASGLQDGESRGRDYNSAVMELGALVCRPRAPLCAVCPVGDFCVGRDRAEALPVKRVRSQTTKVTERREWVSDGKTVWLERSEGPRWRGMWVMPVVPVEGRRSEGRVRSDGADVLVEETYPITRYLVRMEVVAGPVRDGLVGFAIADLEGVAVPTPHRRVMRRLLDGEEGGLRGGKRSSRIL